MAEQDDMFRELLERTAVVSDLSQAHAVLSWDENTYMPEGAAEARGQQMATLDGIVHERLADPAMDDLVSSLEAAGFPEDSVEWATVRQARRAVDRAIKLPPALVEALGKHIARSRVVWARARQESDFASFAPELQRMLELKREEADALGYPEHRYDALHDLSEPGSTAARLRAVFTPLRRDLARLVAEIRDAGSRIDDGILYQPFDEAAQERFAMDTVKAFGYDLEHGRLDRTVHPFATALSKYDVRITTRYQGHFFNPALFGTMHETGHALYEQGVADAYYRTPLEGTCSLGVHESQSRLWENLVGRSRPFWEGAYPRLQRTFPAQFGDVGLDAFYAAINRVEPSFIRVEADEVTYNLHIMLRFELELALLEGSLSVADLPAAWNDGMQDMLGITPDSDANGVLQDVHWSIGLIGYFPTYALGNIISVQLFEAARAAHPQIAREIREGQFGTLLGWLRENVHRHGARYLPEELLVRATGGGLDAGPYLRYLREKYTDLYGLR
ncbi:MAG TPA: carboxypeptidase M32 [Trueperaceae bacterium]|nr:carboxypeptidase M32 [Trueperaceae bacterium]